MDKKKEFQIFYHFCGIGKKTIKASSLEEAKQIAEADDSIHFDEIVRLTKPCRVDETLSRYVAMPKTEDHHAVEYKSWGSE